MKNNFNRIQILFIAILLTNIFLSGSCFFLWQKIGDSAGKIDVRVKELATQEMQESGSYQLASFVKKEIDPADEQIMNYFVNRDNFIEFVEHIETLADKARVNVSMRSTELADSLQLGIDFDGSFNNSMYFVALVESLPINLKVNNVRIEQASDDGSWQGWVTVELPGSGECNKQ